MPHVSGSVCLILHAHLPFVRHPEHEDFLEERWFFEAMTETYLPLLRVLEGLEDDRVDYHLLLSLSPTLVTMMEDPLLLSRYEAHLHKVLDLAERETHRTRHEGHLNFLARWYRDLFRHTLHMFQERCRRRPALAFARLATLGHLELMTCTATHGFLPLLREDPGAVEAQVHVGCDTYAGVFATRPSGIWLPECAYHAGVETILREAGLDYFVLESHGILHADPPPVYGTLAPVYLPNGIAAFARDPESSKQVWSGEEGYPGHPTYREFYRDIGYELDAEVLREVLVDGQIRTDTGLKYWRITGQEEKALYDPHAAREQAAIHAQDFLERRTRQIVEASHTMDRRPVVVTPYDAELFGHWWFEGPIFLDMLLRKMHFDQDAIETSTPSRVLHETPTNQVTTPAGSSWGAEGHYGFWLSEKNSWIYPLLHDSAERFRAALSRGIPPDSSPAGRALRQAGRELLLAQSSDWPFIIQTGTSPEYATRRVREHLARFEHLLQQATEPHPDERSLAALESIDAIFPAIDLHHFLGRPAPLSLQVED